MLDFVLKIEGELYFRGDAILKDRLDEEGIKNAVNISIYNYGCEFLKFSGEDISVCDICEVDESEDYVTISCSIFAEQLLSTEEFSHFEELRQHYDLCEISCDSNYDVDCSELIYSIEE